MHKQHGYSLAEALTAVAIAGFILGVSIPAFETYRRKDALRAAVGEIRSLFHFTRARAIARGRNVALRFRRDGGHWYYAMYEDGDGDGVRNDDIRRGRDPLVRSARMIAQDRGTVTIGMPQFSITDPDTGNALPPHTPPVQFNQSALCSFSPGGTATAGSIFLTNEHHDVVAVRVYGATARIRALRYDRMGKRWR